MVIDQPSDASSHCHAFEERVGVDDCYDLDSEINLAPLNVLRPESMGSKLKKHPGGRVKERTPRTESYKRKRSWPAVSKSAESNNHVNSMPRVLKTRHYQISEEVDDVIDMRSPDPGTEDSDGVPSFKNFNIFIDGLLINDEIFPGSLREVYYELCRDRKGLLHRNLPKKLTPALVLGVIMQTAIIAKGMRSDSSREDLAAWKRILGAFEHLGMDVGFLRKRVDDLLGLLTARSSTDQQPSVKLEDVNTHG